MSDQTEREADLRRAWERAEEECAKLRASNDRWRSRHTAAQESLRAVEALHVRVEVDGPEEDIDGRPLRPTFRYACETCHEGDFEPAPWPCATIRALASPVESDERAGCVGLCGHGADPSACPSGCSPVESDAEAGAADTQSEGEPELCGLEACDIGGFCQARSGCEYGEAAADREGGEGR